MKYGHKANLDLLRATAITVVIIYHVSQFCPNISSAWKPFFALGTYGVDLFFVLSGWLIGGIFFREYKQLGHVNLSRFWGRRWLRTMPPYYVVLLVSWLAVYLTRKQAFELDYLFFIQNYNTMPPFFLVSWSLCVEEHFYVFLPLVLLIGITFDIVIGMCVMLIGISVIARMNSVGTGYPDFGYLLTATHLRLDGLSLGVLCSFVYTMKSSIWHRFSSYLTISSIGCGVAGLLLYYFNGQLMYSVGILLISVSCTGLLCLAVNTADQRIASNRVTTLIANMSYSLYLTHALIIQIVLQFIPAGGSAFIASVLVAIIVAGYIFYRSIEVSSKEIRNRFFPPLSATTVVPAQQLMEHYKKPDNTSR